MRISHVALLCVVGFAASGGRADDKPAPAAKNLVANGDMEAVADGKPAKWTAICADGGKIDFASSTAQPKQGKRCMLVTGGAEWGVVHSERMPVDRKKTYTFT